jgi:integrase
VLTEEGLRLFASLTAGKLGNDPVFVRHDGGVWGKSHQLRPMLEACKRAKINPAISFHVLRHTHGSTLAMRGVPMGVIAEQLGHADTRMTESTMRTSRRATWPTRSAPISPRWGLPGTLPWFQ